MERKEFFLIALKYVTELAIKKPYNLQTIAINNNINFDLVSNYRLFNTNYEDFSEKYSREKIPDNVLKNDGLSFRNMYLISPYHYLYYNYQVFLLYYYLNITHTELSLLNYSNQSIFYAGKIEFDKKNISVNSVFNTEYSNFIEERNKLENSNMIVSLDLKGFFDEVDTKQLTKKLAKLVNNNKDALNVVNNISDFFRDNNFDSLPQIHYSVASSYLSQLYLNACSNSFSKLLKKYNCYAVRYVDDVFVGFYEILLIKQLIIL